MSTLTFLVFELFSLSGLRRWTCDGISFTKSQSQFVIVVFMNPISPEAQILLVSPCTGSATYSMERTQLDWGCFGMMSGMIFSLIVTGVGRYSCISKGDAS